MAGDAARWGDLEHLLADAVDVLQLANWQRIGKRTAQRPKPVSRPGAKAKGVETYGQAGSYTPEQLEELMAGRVWREDPADTAEDQP